MTETPHVVIVGGGISGLAAAYELATSPSGRPLRVSLFEASGRVGGVLRTDRFEGAPLDMAADGFLSRRPEATALARAVGLGDSLRSMGTSGASLFARGRPRKLPEGLALGVPTRLWPVARSGALSALGVARLALDRVAPMPDSRGPLPDRALGPLVARRLGREVVDRLVEPMLGGIYAGSVADASTAAIYPLLLEVAKRPGSFMRALGEASRGGVAPGPPARLAERTPMSASPFYALADGMESLAAATAGAATAHGAAIHLDAPVEAIERSAGGWAVSVGGRSVHADALILAVPAPKAASILTTIEARAAAVLRSIDHSSVAVVTFLLPSTSVDRSLYGTGLLVPRATPSPGGRSSCLITALTYLSHKWPHLARPGSFLIRASVGRIGDTRFASIDDESLIAQVHTELAGLVGLRATPAASALVRWTDALPQYRVHHLARIAQVRASLDRLAPIELCGAAYNGVGIPACIGSGRSAATRISERLSPRG